MPKQSLARRVLEAADLLFEDEHILAINKPPGINFHCENGREGVVRQVKTLMQNEALFPVHRLDRVTSGLMLFAKTEAANQALSERFRERQIEKYYVALACNRPAKKQGSVIGDMSKARNGAYMLTRDKTNPAITRLQVYSLSQCETVATHGVLLKPETGKTHQLRVAMKALGAPILGDARYGGQTADRVYLHALRKRFELFGTDYDVIAPDFCGQVMNASLTQCLSQINHEIPEINWPKGSFLLSGRD
ncbi:MAG: pseudouridine synthase [Oleiphilaceae bacterium]|nr:pseudouridine synthase [Oleiphilaceae bacterium]